MTQPQYIPNRRERRAVQRRDYVQAMFYALQHAARRDRYLFKLFTGERQPLDLGGIDHELRRL